MCVLVVAGGAVEGEGRLHPASNHSASACLSHCERRLHLKLRQFEGAGAERRRPGLPQRSLLSFLAFFFSFSLLLLPLVHVLPPLFGRSSASLGFSALLFSPQSGSLGVTMETGSGSRAGTDDRRRRRRRRR